MNRFRRPGWRRRRHHDHPHYNRRLLLVLSVILVAGALSSLAWSGEVLFKGSSISLAKSFMCGGAQPSGPYDLMVAYEPKPQEQSLLTVSKGGKTLCQVQGSSTSENTMESNKVRVFTKVNGSHEAIQVDIVLPSGVRSRIPNQVFYLPLSKD